MAFNKGEFPRNGELFVQPFRCRTTLFLSVIKFANKSVTESIPRMQHDHDVTTRIEQLCSSLCTSNSILHEVKRMNAEDKIVLLFDRELFKLAIEKNSRFSRSLLNRL